MTKSPAERQAQHRARLAQSGLAEVRGIFAPPDLHPAIRETIRQLLAGIPKERTRERK